MPAPSEPRLFVCFHGHFYQPPRENPWLDAIERQPSAAPYHDWNERVSAECYAPNAAARVLDRQGRIAQLRNNYAEISFNFGPTLLRWLARHAPEVYAAVLEADRASARRCGHGNALAQVYGHAILPLASARDQRTQVRWGVADFVHRFGRKPVGMWLPETAVDLSSLRRMADEGIRFTILSPTQAARVSLHGGPFQPVDPSSLDPTRPYRCELGGGKSIVLFFYDGTLAHGIAFGELLRDGRALAAQIVARGLERTGQPLVHVAADGETYGHHHRFGDMALAAALDELERDARVKVTNYAAYLARVAVADRVEIHERTAWSCAHGLARWSTGCPCHAGHPEWQHDWRGPLREALDWCKERLDELFERRAARWLRDPWAARDAYIQVLLRPTEERRSHFLHEHAVRPLGNRERVAVWKLLEMQHNALLMFTSCGWFFDDPSGLETTQILSYAARAVELGATFGPSLEPELRQRLSQAKSNVAQYGDAAGVYRQLVRPRMYPPERVVAHYAMHTVLEPPGKTEQSYTYALTTLERAFDRGATASFAAGQVAARNVVTEDTRTFDYAVVHFGGHEFRCAVSPARTGVVNRRPSEFLAQFRTQPLAEVLRQLEVWFPGPSYSLDHVFEAEQRKILERVTADIRARTYRLYERVVDENRRLIEFLNRTSLPLPPELRVAVAFVLQRRWDERVSEFVAGEAELDELLAILDDARRWKISLDHEETSRRLGRALEQTLAQAPQWDDALVRRAEALLDAALALGVLVDLTGAQNSLFRTWVEQHERWPEALRERVRELARRIGFGW